MKENDGNDEIYEGLNESGPLTIKQEKFVQLYIKYMNASRAYREAYNHNSTAGTSHTSASNLLRNPKVTMRITEVQAEIAQEFKITNYWIFQQYTLLHQQAIEKESPNTALKALEGMNKMLGGLKLSTEDVITLQSLTLNDIDVKLAALKAQQEAIKKDD